MRVGDIFITGTTIKSLFNMLLTCSTVNQLSFIMEVFTVVSTKIGIFERLSDSF